MRRISWALLLIFAFTIPWEYSLDLGEPLGSIGRIAGLVLLLAFIPHVLLAGKIRIPGLLQLLVVSIFLWFSCSYFWSIDPPATLQRMRALAQVMMPVWMIWELVDSPERIRHLMRAFIGGSWVLAALTIANFATSGIAEQVRFAAEGQDPNDVARFLDLGLPLAGLLAISDENWWGKLLAWGYLPLGLVGVLLTASRGGFLAAVLAIAGCALLMARVHGRMALAAFLALPVVGAIVSVVAPHETIARLATIPEQLVSGNMNQRFNIWAAGWQAFLHAPWLGSGAGSFVAASGLAEIDTAHNTALAIAVEGGLGALALALGIVFSAVYSVLGMRGTARIGFGAALTVLIVTSTVATVEGNRSTWFLLALIAVAARLSAEMLTPADPLFEFHSNALRRGRRSEIPA